jgi:hypothetical protein
MLMLKYALVVLCGLATYHDPTTQNLHITRYRIMQVSYENIVVSFFKIWRGFRDVDLLPISNDNNFEQS